MKYCIFIIHLCVHGYSCSKLPYEVSNDQALSHDEVKQRISKTIQVLMDATEKFQQTILSSVARIP